MKKIRITAEQKVRYDQTVEVSDDEYDRLMLLLRKAEEGTYQDGRRFDEAAGAWLDLSNIDDGDPIENVEIEDVP